MRKKVKIITIYQAPVKKGKRNIYYTVFIGLFATFCLIIFELTIIPTLLSPQKAFSSDDSPMMSLTNLLSPAPSPAVSYPLTIMLNKNEPLQEDATSSSSFTASASAVENINTEYCLNVPVLYYHHVQPVSMATLLGHDKLTVDSDIFTEQMHYLSINGYTTISAEQLALAILNQYQLPEKTVVITIDDGYEDTYSYVYPVMKEYNFIASIMIPAGLIGKPGYLTWLHLKDMLTTNNIKVYNHTWSHAALGLLTPEQIDTELSSASAAFKNNLNLDNNTVFTYPYGSYNDVAIEELNKLGFYAAFSTEPGTQQCLSTIMRLPRTRIGNEPMSSYGF